jgi:hypothetical protein
MPHTVPASALPLHAAPAIGARLRPSHAAAALLWAAAVVAATSTGALAELARWFLPAYAGLVALGIVLPVLVWRQTVWGRRLVDAIGLRRLTLFHVWRIPAALLFFYYGLRGELPLAFWLLAGVGDLLAGAYATLAWRRQADAALLRRIHRFGLADFVVAVGTGLTFTLVGDPRMVLLTTLPMALVPLFGVGLSGASHLIALRLLGADGGQRP